jgi:hypothetical protein
MFFREAKNGTVQTKVIPPSIEVFRFLEEFSFIDFACNVGVEITLKGPLDKFHTDCPSLRIPFIQSADDLQFAEVMIVPLVTFPNENGARSGYIRYDRSDISTLASSIDGVDVKVSQGCEGECQNPDPNGRSSESRHFFAYRSLTESMIARNAD